MSRRGIPHSVEELRVLAATDQVDVYYRRLFAWAAGQIRAGERRERDLKRVMNRDGLPMTFTRWLIGWRMRRTRGMWNS